MKTIVLHILTVLLLLPWPLAVMTAPMMFGGPGASDDRGNILLVLGVFLYPVVIFAVYRIMGWNFFSLSSSKLLIASFIICLLVIFVFNLPKMLFNTYRGVSNSGYSKTKDSVFYSGDKISSDPDHFEELENSYARDTKNVYHYGKKLEGLDPKTFSVENYQKKVP